MNQRYFHLNETCVIRGKTYEAHKSYRVTSLNFNEVRDLADARKATFTSVEVDFQRINNAPKDYEANTPNTDEL